MVPAGRPDLPGAGGDLSPGRVFVIFNPASGRGRGAKRIPEYRELLKRHLPGYDEAVTTYAGEEADLAGRAVEGGYETVVAMGGDGTWSHVADRLLRSGADVRLGLLPSGTGNDFGRNLGLDPRDPVEAVRGIAAGRIFEVDVGRVLTPSRPANGGGGEVRRGRHFLNLVGFGFDIAVIDAARGARFLRGELLYKLTALQELFRFAGLDVSLEDASGFRTEGRHLMITVSNGCYFGGGFPIAPGAAVDDGALHACIIRDAGPLGRAALFHAAGRGRHAGSSRVELRPAPAFRLGFAAPPRFEIDGDVFQGGGPELEVEVIPGALRIVGAPAADPARRTRPAAASDGRARTGR